MAKLNNYSLLIGLQPEQVAKIEKAIPEETSTENRLARVATSLLMDLATGGIMLSPAEVKHIREALPDPTGDNIVEAVERGVNRRRGHYVAEWEIDPVYLPYLQEIAQSRGRTIEWLIQEGMSWVMDKGWLYDFVADAAPLKMSETDHAEVAAILGKPHFTGTDVAEWIKARSEKMVGILE